MIRHIVLATVSAIALTASANAADVYQSEGNKGDELYVPPSAWSGFYMGANGGYAFDAWSSHGGILDNGGFGGGQIGYNWQGVFGLSPNLVLGVEADFQGADIDHTGHDTIHWDNGRTSPAIHHRSIDNFGSVRGRIGYSLDRTLVYFTGGFAYGSLRNTFDVAGRNHFVARGNYNAEAIESGYTLGGGVEYKLTPAWSLKAEYQFIDLGSDNATNGQGGFIRTRDTELNTVRAGINYHFNSTLDALTASEAVGGYKDGAIPVAAWAGLYTGVNGGYAWGAESELSDNADITICRFRGGCTTTAYSASRDFSRNGGFGGGQIGYNWQRDRLVYGVEADIQGADASGSATVTPLSGSSAHASANLDWFGTVRGRLGLVAFDRGLVYVTGGFAYGGVEDKLTASGDFLRPMSFSQSQVATGYVLGGGVEYAFSPSWSIKAEYQYLDLDAERLSATLSRGNRITSYSSTAVSDSRDSFNTVRVGLNYRLAPAYEPLK